MEHLLLSRPSSKWLDIQLWAKPIPASGRVHSPGEAIKQREKQDRWRPRQQQWKMEGRVGRWRLFYKWRSGRASRTKTALEWSFLGSDGREVALSRKADSRENRRQTGSEAGHLWPIQRRSDKVISVDLEKERWQGWCEVREEAGSQNSYSFVGFYSESVLWSQLGASTHAKNNSLQPGLNKEY